MARLCAMVARVWVATVSLVRTSLVQHLENGRSVSKSASLSVMTRSGQGYQQSVQVDSLMIEHDFELN